MGAALVEITSLSTVEPAEIERLLDAAFGTDRHARTAYRLRAGQTWLADLSFAVRGERALIASLQSWPVRHVASDGAPVPLVLVGPVAVTPDGQGRGLGTALMRRLLKAAARNAAPPMMMVGDPKYYGRFGFTAEATAGWHLPGPVEPRRLLASPGAPSAAGEIVGGW